VPLVNVMVNGRAYTIACDQGEEEHLKQLSGVIDAKVKELLGSVGQVGDQRLLLMAALLMADEQHEAVTRLEEIERELTELKRAQEDANGELARAENVAAAALESAAARLEDIAARLSRA